MAVDNRLTAVQPAVLAPGDLVTIEFARDFRKPKFVSSQVVRFVGSQIVVFCRMSDGGSKYVHNFDRRGVRIGSGQYAELVEVNAPAQRRTAAPTTGRRQGCLARFR